MDDPISLDEYLEREASNTGLTFVILPVPGHPSKIRLLPQIPGCRLAITIERASIQSVTPAPSKCGCKGSSPVRINFKKGASLPLEELFAQLAERGSNHIRAQGLRRLLSRRLAPMYVHKYLDEWGDGDGGGGGGSVGGGVMSWDPECEANCLALYEEACDTCRAIPHPAARAACWAAATAGYAACFALCARLD